MHHVTDSERGELEVVNSEVKGGKGVVSQADYTEIVGTWVV